jgi:hypothetical protein
MAKPKRFSALTTTPENENLANRRAPPDWHRPPQDR